MRTRRLFLFWSRTGAGKLCPTGEIQLPPLLINKSFPGTQACSRVHILSAHTGGAGYFGWSGRGCKVRTLTLWPFSRTGEAVPLWRNQRMDMQTRRNATVFWGNEWWVAIYFVPIFFLVSANFLSYIKEPRCLNHCQKEKTEAPVGELPSPQRRWHLPCFQWPSWAGSWRPSLEGICSVTCGANSWTLHTADRRSTHRLLSGCRPLEKKKRERKFKSLTCPGYCKQCRKEHWGSYVF